MNRLLIKGGLLITPAEERPADLLLEGERIAALGSIKAKESAGATEIEAEGCFVSPGLIDLQVNGGPECDFWGDLSLAKLAQFSRRLLSSGVTAILPTLITSELSRLQKNRDFLKAHLGLARSSDKELPLLRMPGIHFEGPCLSPQKPGVHPPEHLLPLEITALNEFVDEACRLITLAPELDPGGSCLEFLHKKGIVCSLGHSNANYEEARLAFARGLSLMTHIFNALPALHHREPGAVAAALLNPAVSCCAIPDGLHVAPPVLQLLYKMKGAEKTILVTDMAAVGTSQGGLVGSSLVLDQAVRNMVEWGICKFAEAIKMASYNPAKVLGLENSIGQIKPGAYADLLIWERKTLKIKQVIFNGALLSRTEEAARAPLQI